jgi:hypothetical protein
MVGDWATTTIWPEIVGRCRRALIMICSMNPSVVNGVPYGNGMGVTLPAFTTKFAVTAIFGRERPGGGSGGRLKVES